MPMPGEGSLRPCHPHQIPYIQGRGIALYTRGKRQVNGSGYYYVIDSEPYRYENVAPPIGG